MGDLTTVKLRGGYGIGGPAEGAGAYVAKLAAKLGRECSNCSLCCKLLNIDVPELVKPAGKWCEHCKPGRGCTIYDRRPTVCRAFGCQWLVDGSFGPEWYPVRSKMVLRMVPNEIGSLTLNVNVDPSYPTAWRKSPYYEHLVDRSSRISVTIFIGGRQIGLHGGLEYELRLDESAIVSPDGTLHRISPPPSAA